MDRFSFLTNKYTAQTALLLSICFMGWHLYDLWQFLDTSAIDWESSQAILQQEVQKAMRLPVREVRRVLSSFAAGVFITLGWYLNKRNQEKDYSLYLLALAMLSWGIPNLWNQNLQTSVLYSLIYSTLNNLFFFLAFCFMENCRPNYNWKIMRALKIKNDDEYLNKVIYFSGLVLFFLITVWGVSRLKEELIVIPLFFDVLLSSTAFIWIFCIFWKSFEKRLDKKARLSMLFYTTTVVLAAIVAQFINAYLSCFDFNGTSPPNGQQWEKVAVMFNTYYNINFIFLIGSLAFTFSLERYISSREKAHTIEQRRIKEQIAWKEKLEEQTNEALKQAETLRQDMLHVIRNSLLYLKSDFGNLFESSANSNQISSLIYKENEVRVGIIHMLFCKMHVDNLDEGIPLNTYLTEVLEMIKDSFHWEYCSFPTSLPDLGYARGTSAQKIAKILVEICINAFKHGKRYAVVEIKKTVKGKDKQLEITISDNGPGYNPDTNVTQKQSLGMKFIKEYLDDLKAEPLSWTVSSRSKGTTFVISIPLTSKILLNHENITA